MRKIRTAAGGGRTKGDEDIVDEATGQNDDDFEPCSDTAESEPDADNPSETTKLLSQLLRNVRLYLTGIISTGSQR